MSFRTSPDWFKRTRSYKIGHCTVIVPDPIDILIGKLNPLEEKDIEAFRRVIARTGHPTQDELIRELRLSVDLFRPAFAEEQATDITGNCRRLWPLIYGREIDPRLDDHPARLGCAAEGIRSARHGLALQTAFSAPMTG